MIIKTISATYGRKVNLGNYESLTIEVTAWADLETTIVLANDGSAGPKEIHEDASEAYRQLFLELRTQVREYILKAKGVKITPNPKSPANWTADRAAGTAFSQDSIAEFQTQYGPSNDPNE